MTMIPVVFYGKAGRRMGPTHDRELNKNVSIGISLSRLLALQAPASEAPAASRVDEAARSDPLLDTFPRQESVLCPKAHGATSTIRRCPGTPNAWVLSTLNSLNNPSGLQHQRLHDNM